MADMENDKKKLLGLHIGKRNLKTGLSVLICLLFYYFTGRDGCLFATVSAIICMQDNVEKSLTSGFSRLAGTVIGAVLGMVFLSIGRVFTNEYLVIVMTTVGIMLLILLSNLLNRSDSIVIGCMVFLSIMIGTSSQSPFLYSINRMLDTFVGIMVAITVNRFVWNPANRRRGEETPDEQG